MQVPVLLTNRDLVDVPRRMVDTVARWAGVGEIIIVDCGSTNPETLKWYATQVRARVILEANRGPRCAWDGDHVPRDVPFYVVSDGDLDLDGIPDDCLYKLRQQLEQNPHVLKAGLSLEVNDLPDGAITQKDPALLELDYWQRLTGGVWDAPIDTTFAMYRGGCGWGGYSPARRLDRPYTAKHVAWYLKPGAIPRDWQFYFDHVGCQNQLMWTPRIKATL